MEGLEKSLRKVNQELDLKTNENPEKAHQKCKVQTMRLEPQKRHPYKNRGTTFTKFYDLGLALADVSESTGMRTRGLKEAIFMILSWVRLIL